MKNLYTGAFESLYKWGHEKLKDENRKNVTVHFSKLHRAPQGSKDDFAKDWDDFAKDWDDFAKEKSITRVELESWLDKAYTTTVEKKWIGDRNRNLNKTSNPKDYPDVVKAMWDFHIYTTNQALVAADIQSKFVGKYKCIVLDKLRPNLASLLASEGVFQWRGGGKTHLFFYFLFDKQEDRFFKPDLLDKVRLKRIFEPLEAAESNGGAFARSGGIIFTNAMGFHAVVSHLETRLRKSK